MALRYDQVADLIKIIDASGCDELVLETAELKLSIRRQGAQGPSAQTEGPLARPAAAVPLPQPAPPSKQAPASGTRSAEPQAGVFEVRSPMVGTFYRAPTPDAPPFVELGSTVVAGDALCVIEVMKLFTTIYAEKSGSIVGIGAVNGELVEYDSLLFSLQGS